MLRVLIVIFCFMISLSANVLLADDSPIVAENQDKPRLISPSNENFQKMAEMNTDIYNVMENDKEKVLSLISSLKYDEDGRLSEVKYQSGNVASYSYALDSDGKLESVKIKDRSGLSVEFSKTIDGLKMLFSSAQPSNETLADTNSDSSFGGPGRPIIIIYPKEEEPVDLEEIAKKPISEDYFKKVKKALDDFSKDNDTAQKEYLAKQDEYYKKIYAALVQQSGLLKSEGVDLGAYFTEARNDPAPAGEQKRTMVDKAVTYIKSGAAKPKTRRTETATFLRLEELYGDSLLISGKDIRDNKIKESLVYLKNIIEELNSSGLSIYLKSNKDKIEAIINLPEAKK